MSSKKPSYAKVAASQPQAGKPPAGQPPAGQPPAGQPPAGQPQAGKPQAGKPQAGQPPAGKPPPGTPQVGQPPAGQPPAGQPPAGQPQAVQPQAGQQPASIDSFFKFDWEEEKENKYIKLVINPAKLNDNLNKVELNKMLQVMLAEVNKNEYSIQQIQEKGSILNTLKDIYTTIAKSHLVNAGNKLMSNYQIGNLLTPEQVNNMLSTLQQTVGNQKDETNLVNNMINRFRKQQQGGSKRKHRYKIEYLNK